MLMPSGADACPAPLSHRSSHPTYLCICPPPGVLSAMDLPLLASHGVPRLLVVARVASMLVAWPG